MNVIVGVIVEIVVVIIDVTVNVIVDGQRCTDRHMVSDVPTVSWSAMY